MDKSRKGRVGKGLTSHKGTCFHIRLVAEVIIHVFEAMKKSNVL